jgi:hypothetical protein
MLRRRLQTEMISPNTPITNPPSPDTTWNVLAWAIVCLRVSCTRSTTGSVLQNLNNLLSSVQEELRQNTVMLTESVLMHIESDIEPGEKCRWRLNNWSQHGQVHQFLWNSARELSMQGQRAKGGGEERRGGEGKRGALKKSVANEAERGALRRKAQQLPPGT